MREYHQITIQSSLPVPSPEDVPNHIEESDCWKRATLIVKAEIVQFCTLSHDYKVRRGEAEKRIQRFLRRTFILSKAEVKYYRHAEHLADWFGEMAGEYNKRYGHTETIADQLCKMLIDLEHFIRDEIL